MVFSSKSFLMKTMVQLKCAVYHSVFFFFFYSSIGYTIIFILYFAVYEKISIVIFVIHKYSYCSMQSTTIFAIPIWSIAQYTYCSNQSTTIFVIPIFVVYVYRNISILVCATPQYFYCRMRFTTIT